MKGELKRKLFLEKAKVLGFELFNRAPIFFIETVFVGGKNGVGTTINLFREIWALASFIARVASDFWLDLLGERQ